MDQLDEHAITQIIKILSVPRDFILSSDEIPSYIYNSKEEIQKTKRPIRRGGIHYYNYYTLPSPKGYVAPVLIDILCPKENIKVFFWEDNNKMAEDLYGTLGVSKGAPPDYYIIPDIVNLSIERAKNAILTAGLRIGYITYEYQPNLLNNTVIEQNMTSGMRVSFPISIDLLVSKDNNDLRWK